MLNQNPTINNSKADEGCDLEIQDLIVTFICIVMAAILLTYNSMNFYKK
jgi:hypothetical protein